MKADFDKFLFNEIKLDLGSKIVLAVSGGIDSMVMLKLFSMSSYKLIAAHCNFQLRGEESNRDQAFVEDKCMAYGIKCVIRKFDTIAYCNENKVSIQVAARDLRYEWFEQLRAENNFDFIATAHHLDDQAETFFINLIRGTGYAGLHGILPRRDKIIRPLMYLQRHQIEHYAKINNISHVNDSSNQADKYLRNYLRHNIIPKFVNLNRNFIPNLANTIKEQRVLENSFINDLNQRFSKMINIEDEKIILEINEVKTLDYFDFYLMEFLDQYGFNKSQVSDIISIMDSSNSGQNFYSKNFSLFKNRGQLIICPNSTNDLGMAEFLIDQGLSCDCDLPFKLNFEIEENNGEITRSKQVASLDYDLLEFPLVLRKWKSGDSFVPLGMNGNKLISDFLIDSKVSSPEKAKTYVLLSSGNIVWVVGHRIDDRYKLTENTNKILKIVYTHGTS